MEVRYPKPLVHGDVIGVAAPSTGAPRSLTRRLDFAVQQLRDRGFAVDMGDCMDGSTHNSAPAEQRARELVRTLLEPKIKAIVPPWGGATAIDLMPHLDFDALASAEPTWFVGYSDMSTFLTPVTLRTGMATLHGSNLLDTPYRVNDWDDWENYPAVTDNSWNGTGAWERLDTGQEDVSVEGRLIGGCIETLVNLASTDCLDTEVLRQDPSGSVVVNVEASSVDATTICRHLHGMCWAGFFDGAKAILVGRTGAPDSATLTQAEAVLDALGMLGVPIIGNVECGHVPPQLPLVNGAQGHLVFNRNDQYLEQILA